MDNKSVLDYLDDELKNTQKPLVNSSDRGQVSDRMLIEDLHCLLTGNGSPQNGIVYKICQIRAVQKDNNDKINRTAMALGEQVKFCRNVQAKKEVEEAKNSGIWYVTKLIWSQKNTILLVLAMAFLYLMNSGMVTKDKLQTAVDAQINKTLVQLVSNTSTNQP